MATYAIGDIHGCFSTLERLLELIEFGPKDHLWVCGDMINRGPNSLETLLFLKQLGSRAKCILGNHELHFLSVARSNRDIQRADTLQDILTSPHRNDLIEWLSHLPLLMTDKALPFVMVHAGIPPFWTLEKAQSYAAEAQDIIRSPKFEHCSSQLFGNQPTKWHPHLIGNERHKCIINALTRMRFLTQEQEFEFSYKGDPENAPPHLIPWYELYSNNKHTELHEVSNTPYTILFGHWACLSHNTRKHGTGIDDIIGLDTGCVWGQRLTAFRLEDRQLFSIAA